MGAPPGILAAASPVPVKNPGPCGRTLRRACGRPPGMRAEGAEARGQGPKRRAGGLVRLGIRAGTQPTHPTLVRTSARAEHGPGLPLPSGRWRHEALQRLPGRSAAEAKEAPVREGRRYHRRSAATGRPPVRPSRSAPCGRRCGRRRWRRPDRPCPGRRCRSSGAVSHACRSARHAAEDGDAAVKPRSFRAILALVVIHRHDGVEVAAPGAQPHRVGRAGLGRDLPRLRVGDRRRARQGRATCA